MIKTGKDRENREDEEERNDMSDHYTNMSDEKKRR